MEDGPAVATVIETRIDCMVSELCEALRSVMDALPGGPHRPQRLARLLNLNKSVSSRVCRALRTADPLAAAHLMPGPEALRVLVSAASRNAVPADVVGAANNAIDAFDELVRREIGDRATLEAIISESLPNAREKFEIANKQAVFKGCSNLRGVRSDVLFTTMIIHPGTDPEAFDLAIIFGMIGLRRLRPGALVQVLTEHLQGGATSDVRQTLDGEHVEGIQGLLLDPYCSHPAPRLSVRTQGARVTYIVDGTNIGPSSAVDLVFAETCPARHRRYKSANDNRTTGACTVIDQPTALMVFDMLLHHEVWPNSQPELRIYDTMMRGLAHPDDASRDMDRLQLHESIEELGTGLRRLRVPDIPNYIEIVQGACGRAKVNPEDLRLFRCQVQYPLYGSEICMVFDPPVRS